MAILVVSMALIGQVYTYWGRMVKPPGPAASWSASASMEPA
jgi:hypothetical protein